MSNVINALCIPLSCLSIPFIYYLTICFQNTRILNPIEFLNIIVRKHANFTAPEDVRTAVGLPEFTREEQTKLGISNEGSINRPRS